MTFNHRVIMRVVSVILLFEGIAMQIPMICAVYYKEHAPGCAFFLVGICCIAFGITVFRYLQYYTLNIKTREGYFVTLISWILVCIIGAMPFFFSDSGYSFVDSLFESVSGLTTTGAHVLNVNTMPKSLILWKAICNWLGGMGIIVLTLSFFPILGIGGQKMVAAEVPGPTLEKFSARIGDTAKTAYKIYIVLTILELCLLLPSGIEPYDAVINTLSSISTSGIVNIHGGVGLHFTPYVKAVLTFFSLAGSINFVMYFFIYSGKFKSIIKNIETRTYLVILSLSAIFMSIILFLYGTYDDFWSSFGNAIVQSVSYGSTSGFSVSDINEWPSPCKIILLILILIGGCGFSTSGSIKVIRVIIYFKLIIRGIYKRIHPHSMKPIMIQNKPVSAENASSVTVFIMLYFAIYIFSCIVMSIDNQDIETTLSATLAAFSNNGTGFGLMNYGDFSIFSNLGKVYSSILMLAGRLEMYAIIILFSRSYWNSDRA